MCLVTKSRENVGFDHRHDVQLLELTKVENQWRQLDKCFCQSPGVMGWIGSPYYFPRTFGLSTVYTVLSMT